MTRRLMTLGLAALCAAAAANAQTTGAAAPASPAKKELVARVLKAQQSDIEGVARSLVERPAAQMMQEAGLAMQRQIAPEKREAVGKQIEAEAKKYVDEAMPIVRERALKIAPSTIGAVLEAKMSEDELKALLAWLDSPTYKKYTSLGGEMRNGFVQQLLKEAGPLVEPKAQALDGRIRVILGVPPQGQAPAGSGPASRPAGK